MLFNILKDISENEKLNKTEEEILEVIESMDIEGISKSARELYTVSIWDKTSKINGVDPSYMLGQAPYNIHDWNGITYIITDNGNDVLVQNHDHTKSELSYIETIDEATLLATEYIQLICESEVINILSSIVLDYDSRGE